MKQKIYKFLDVDPKEGPRVVFLLVMSFFMGVFIATFSVASQSLFLREFVNQGDLPLALFVSGGFGLIATLIYNFLQNRIPFPWLATGSLVVITGLTAFVEFGQSFFADQKSIYFFGFASLLPFSFIILLVFWGAFARLFNLRQSKRLLGNVDQGALIASFFAFFLIPQFLTIEGVQTETLYTVSLVSIATFLVLFVFLSIKFLNRTRSFAEEKVIIKK